MDSLLLKVDFVVEAYINLRINMKCLFLFTILIQMMYLMVCVLLLESCFIKSDKLDKEKFSYV